MDWIAWWKNRGEAHRVYPEPMTCRLCGRDVFGEGDFCEECRQSLPYNTVYCLRCGRGLRQTGYCADCRREMPPFTARALFRYEDFGIRFVLQLKESERTSGVAPMVARESLPLILANFPDVDLLTFVPSEAESMRRRGYNQAEVLARSIADKLGLEVEELFTRVKKKDAQKTLSRRERLKNLHGAFHLKKRKGIEGKVVLIVDDVLTTGGTAEALTKLLLGAKAAKVYVFTVASGVPLR